MMKIAGALIAVLAGAAVGAVVFKVVGEERVGAEVKKLGARFGVRGGADSGALDLIEQFAPGTRSGFEGAVIGTVAASLIATAAVTLTIREITS